MVRTTIDNVHRRFYVRMLVVLVALTALVAVGVHIYYGSFTEKGQLDFEENLHLGDTFTVDELAENSGYSRLWIKDGTAKVNIYYTDADGNDISTDGLIRYDPSTKTFTVKGVSYGKIEFVNSLDPSVTYSVTFRTGFNSADTLQILQDNNCMGRGALYSSASERIYLEEDLSVARYLNLPSDQELDLKDICRMPALNRISIIGSTCASYRNVELPDTIHVYVDQAVYREYQEEGSSWKDASGKIFLEEGLDRYSIMYELNGGESDLLAEGHFYTSLFKGESLAKSPCPVPSRIGYLFGGWCPSTDGGTNLGEAMADGSVPDSDLKLYAKWVPASFNLRFHYNFGEDRVSQFGMVYDVTSLDLAGTFAAEGYTLAGWSHASDSTVAEFVPNESFRNFLHDDGASDDLYAVWYKDVYSVRLLNEDGTVLFELSGCRLGETVSIPSEKPVNSESKSFIGWVLNLDVPDKYHPAGSMAPSFNVLPGMSGCVDLHPLFSSTTYTVQLDFAGGEVGDGNSVLTDRIIGEDLVLSLPNKAYQKFTYWTDANGTRYSANAEDLQNGTLTISGGIEGSYYVKLTAHYEYHSFKVALSGTTKIVTMGKSNTLPSVDSYTGYTATVYSDNISGRWVGGGSLSTANMQSLYAVLKGGKTDNQFDESKIASFGVKYTPVTIKVTFNVSTNPSSKTVTYASTYGELPTPGGYTVDNGKHHEEYGFSRWTYGGTEITSSTKVTMVSDHQLTAEYKKVKEWDDACIAPGTEYITENGTVLVENLSEGDRVLAFNHVSGEFEFQPISFITIHPGTARTFDLKFDNGAHLEMSTEHGLFDMDLNRYVMISEANVDSFIGHRFAYMEVSEDGSSFVPVTLTGYEFGTAETTYSLLTAYDICSLNNGLLSMPADIDGLYNMFEFGSGLVYDEERMAEDIGTYGYFEYEPYSEYLTREEFEMFGAQYLAVSIGKGLTSLEGIQYLIETYLLGGYLECH